MIYLVSVVRLEKEGMICKFFVYKNSKIYFYCKEGFLIYQNILVTID